MKNEPSLLRNRAYKQIRAHLVLGELPAGSSISEPKLAKKLGIGRTPVREAIQQLEVEGLLERSPRRGTIVRRPQRQDIVDLFEVREGIESHAAFLAANRIGPQDIERLHMLCNQLDMIATQLEETGEQALDDAMLRQFLAADMGFHMLLISATGNHRLIKIVSDSHALSRIFGTLRQEHTIEIVRGTHRLHVDILKTLEGKDAEKARELMTEHIRKSCNETLEHFDRQHRETARTATGMEHLLLPSDLLNEFDRMGLSLNEAAKSKKPE